MKKLATILALVLAFTSLSSTAHADDFAKIVSEGMKAYNEENYDVAIEKFFEAKLLNDAPELVYNIARAYHKKGRCDLAQKHYDQFLARGDAPDKLVKKAKGHSESLGECPTEGTLALTCLPKDANVQIDGNEMGACGKFELEQGRHVLVVTAPGHKPADREVMIEPGQVEATTVSLEIAQTAPPPDEGGGFNWLGFSLVTVGVGLITGAIVIDVVNQENLDELDSLPKGDPDRTSFEDAHATNQALIWTFGSIGIAAAATGTVLWIMGIGDGSGGDEAADAGDWNLAPTVTSQGGGAALHVTF